MRDGKFHLITKLGFYNETEESFNILTLPFADCNGLIDKFLQNGQIFIKFRQAHQSIHVLALFRSLDAKNLVETVVSPNSWAVRINPELSAFVRHSPWKRDINCLLQLTVANHSGSCQFSHRENFTQTRLLCLVFSCLPSINRPVQVISAR